MSIFLEITQLENGDIVLREADDDATEQKETSSALNPQNTVRHGSTAAPREPLLRISFSAEVRNMLGGDLVGVAEAMVDAATDYLGGETVEADADEIELEAAPSAPVIH